MTKIYPQAFMENKIVPIEEANLSVASSAVLYGLSVYTVFPVISRDDEKFAFRLEDHFQRLLNSAKIIGIDTFEEEWNLDAFKKAIAELLKANTFSETIFVRATVHVDELAPGTRSRGLKTVLSMFIYEATPIIPQDGARLKTSVWRRTPDYAIPSRAKVNGAYINSVLGKQDAIDSGYDDCLFLDTEGHVCELSAANIFMVQNGTLVTPGRSSDILEGLNRRTVIEIAEKLEIPVVERNIDLTEIYTADEVFACGTSAFIAPIIEIDARKIGNGDLDEITKKIKQAFSEIMEAGEVDGGGYLVKVG
jgi:branched-chain amino acid aminotransferase